MYPIKSVLAKHKLRAKKRFGQNFLTDESILKIIAETACANNGPVLEIGAGIGNLTELIAARTSRLFVVEKDRDLAPRLKQVLSPYPNAELFIQDILKVELKPLAGKNKLSVVGNLPFYITSPIILRLIEQRAVIDAIYITVQKEVALRMVARPGKKDYGRLSCLVQYYTAPEMIRMIPRTAFFPQPNVDSAFVAMPIRKKPAIIVQSEKMFFRVVKAIFSQRRKTLLNCLLAGGFGKNRQELSSLLTPLSLDEKVRGETLDLTMIGRIADSIGQN